MPRGATRRTFGDDPADLAWIELDQPLDPVDGGAAPVARAFRGSEDDEEAGNAGGQRGVGWGRHGSAGFAHSVTMESCQGNLNFRNERVRCGRINLP